MEQQGRIDITAESELVGQRVDRALARLLPGMSRTRVQAAIDAGRITVDGRPVKASMLLEAGMCVDVSPPDESVPAPGIDDIPADVAMPAPGRAAIVYEDADLLVVDKPAGLVVHPAPGHPRSTLVDQLISQVAELRRLGDLGGRPGIVHRLDKDTSGLLVVAKHEAAHANLAEQMKSRTTIKRYLALVEGRLSPLEGIIDAPIGRDPRSRQRMAVVRAGGRPARTRFRVLSYAEGRTLVEVQLESGRTHQIRVHMAAINHPVVGDSVYGRPEPGEPPRQFLHAAHLEFRHPRTRQWMVFDAPLPADLAAFAAPWMPQPE